MKEVNIKELEKKLRRWDELTIELCEEFYEVFDEPKPDAEVIEIIRELVAKYEWDNIALSPYIIPEIEFKNR